MFHRWQQQFFEIGASALAPRARSARDRLTEKVKALEEKLTRKNEVLSELMEEHVKLNKGLGCLAQRQGAAETRDALVDCLRYWSACADLSQRQMIIWLGIPASKYYDWRRRYGQPNGHNGQTPRTFWLLPEERRAILGFQTEHPEEGHRRLCYMMLDANVAAVTVRAASTGCSRARGGSTHSIRRSQPSQPHAHWHIDVAYLHICGTFCYLCTVLDGYRRYIVHWEIRETMTEGDVETILQRAHQAFPEATPCIISHNGPQFVARDFKAFVRSCGMTHVHTSPHYPQSNGKIESWHNTVKRECICFALNHYTPNVTEPASLPRDRLIDEHWSA